MEIKKNYKYWTVLLLFTLLTVLNFSPQSTSSNYKLVQDILDEGFSSTQSGQFKVRSSLGNPLDTKTTKSVNFKVFGGFYVVESTESAVVATPIFNPPAGTYSDPQTVTITCTTPGAEIYFTTNGLNPTQADLIYSESISISETTTLKAKAFKDGWISSNVASGTYSFGISITGKIWDYDGQDPIKDTKIITAGDTMIETAANAEGEYTISSLPPNSTFSTKPSHPGMFFLPSRREYNSIIQSATDQYFIGSLYGDVSGNDDVKSFDASMVLRHVVDIIEWENETRDLIAADVSGNGAASAFDASLILQFAAGLIKTFPVENKTILKNISVSDDVNFYTEIPPLVKGNRIIIPLSVDKSSGIYSLEMCGSFLQAYLQLVTISTSANTKEFILNYSERPGKILVAMASATPNNFNGKFLFFIFDVLKSMHQNVKIDPLIIEDISLNESKTPVMIDNTVSENQVILDEFYLMQNFPNPFNPRTKIGFSLPKATRIRLEIYNSLGQLVKILVDKNMEAGIHSVFWDGEDENGLPSSSGIYVSRLTAGNFIAKKKMLLIK